MEYIYSNILVLLAILVIMIFFKRSKAYLLENLRYIKSYLIEQLQFVLKNSINYLSKIEFLLSKNNPTSNELSLEDLTANITDEKNINKLKTYLDALQFAIANKNVINIALTGGFGTGKSTIINEFCKKNRCNEYLHISLANFKDEVSNEKLIETSIVQQILYYEKKRKIKESSYRRIDFTKPFYKIVSIFLLIIWFYTGIYLFFESINDKIIIFNGENTNINAIRIVFLLGIINILYKSYDKLKNIKFSKLTPNSLEIVNEKTSNELSVFNRNIDEIIYFFEKTNTNIVIVEDIDRFSDDIAIKLYSKIRELSILIKQSKDVNQTVKFIYSVKDELILEDKTKFFDIIIPVIPITDYNNSKNMFLLKLDDFFEKEKTEEGSKDKNYLDNNFISEVSNYVYDMRTVINICNEFKLYDKILSEDKPNIDKNKLFGIIFYKNIYPTDFARIQKNDSKLHNIFNKDFEKDEILKKIVSDIDAKLQIKKDKKIALEELLDNQIINDINELRNIYVFNMIGMIYIKHNVKITTIEKLNIGFDLISDENFCKLKESNNIIFGYEYYPDNKSGISFLQVQNKVHNEQTYDEREKLILDFHNHKIIILESEIFDLNNKRQNILNQSICELYINYNIEIDNFLDSIFTNKITKKDNNLEFQVDQLNPNVNLFKYLLKNDYLNEDFIEYVSYFHPGSLSPNDHKLMMKINQNELTSFDEKIENVENLIKNIRDIRFKNQSILIYDIFKFLLKDCQSNYLRSEKLNFILSQIKNYKDESVFFIEGFIRKIKNENDSDNLSNFYVEITKWDSFWHLVQTSFSDDLKRIVLFDLIHLFSDSLGDETLLKLNKKQILTNYINTDSNLLKDVFEIININSFIQTLKILNVQFKLISPYEKIKDLLLKVYENNLYQVKIDNLKLFCQIDGKYNYSEEDFLQSNFSFLRANEETYLYKRICKNLNEYVENIYLGIEENINEKPEEVLFLLEQKNEVIILENKLQIIKKGFNDKLEKFGKINSKEVEALLIENNKIYPSWENILEYYSWDGELDLALINFLNCIENYSNLSVSFFSEKYEELFYSEKSGVDFIYELINNDNISQDSFERIFEISGSLNLESNNINSEFRISYLIEKDFLILDEIEFVSLYEKNKDLLIRLIEKNENKFVSEIDEYNFDIDFIENLLNSKLSIENLISIINDFEAKIIEIGGLDLLNRIARFYIENKVLDYTYEMFEKLISSDLNEEYKVGMFSLYFSDKNSNEYEIPELLQMMGGRFMDFIDKKELHFDKNDQNEGFLKILKANNLIASYKKESRKGILSVHFW